uniref:Lipoxygenase n=1 Tax=Knipowitschia caucasica TaxID=637954 RepID=A0AAV2MFN6_KNICA
MSVSDLVLAEKTVPKMSTYEVTVFTGNRNWAGTSNNIYIKLIGRTGESDRTCITPLLTTGFWSGQQTNVRLSCSESLGDLIMVELDKQSVIQNDSWFVDKVEVQSPEGKVFKFPMYHWIQNEKVHSFMEGTAQILSQDQHHLTLAARKRELQLRKYEYCWTVYSEGLPHCIKAESASDLPPEVQFSFTKDMEIKWNVTVVMLELKLAHFKDSAIPWSDMDSIKAMNSRSKTTVTEYVEQNWEKDEFFGYQYLNGLNPMMIRRCSSLPANFPVTDDMLHLEGFTLEQEMKNGNMFLCDYKMLDGVKTNIINDKKQYLAAPLVLFHKTSDDELKPVAIQLKQTAAEDNPIFVPTDTKYDWLLAKTFVRAADFMAQGQNRHLLRTHLLSEVFSVSLLRNFPRVHPLYKLLVPHTRYTLHINIRARERLISKDGILAQNSACGADGIITILQRALSSVTYSSLCVPDNIKERGVEKVPNYYYRDDALKLWDIMHRFVTGVIKHYYKNDAEVKDDSELQAYIKEIFEYGFLSETESGIPQTFCTVDELVKFVTMVIFNSSAQHTAVNNGHLQAAASPLNPGPLAGPSAWAAV